MMKAAWLLQKPIAPPRKAHLGEQRLTALADKARKAQIEKKNRQRIRAKIRRSIGQSQSAFSRKFVEQGGKIHERGLLIRVRPA